MELLDAVPADAIAIRLHSLLGAAAGSLCAWLIAALAAAVGLWRIRAVGAGGVRSAASALADTNKEQEQQQAPPPSSPAAVDEPAPAPSSSVSEPCTPSKVRFTAYYAGSAGGDGDDDGVVDDGVKRIATADDDDRGVETVVLRRTASEPGRRRRATAPWEWEQTTEMAARRRSDLGWYRHIDMAALDGSVVRLWDAQLAASPRPRGRRTRRAGLEVQLSL